MNKKDDVLRAIMEQGMLPLFYHNDIAESILILQVLYESGVRVFEFTNRGERAEEVFQALLDIRNKEMQDMFLGIGTVKNKDEAVRFLEIGADFIVSPVVDADVGDLVHGEGKLWVPGCMTPTEIYLAQTHNAALIKLFPANILGPVFLKTIKDLFKEQLFIPTGGVELELGNIKSWFNAGVCAVGLGSKLISPPTIEGLKDKTILALELIRKARE